MNHIGLVIAGDVNEDFSALTLWLEITYGAVVALLPNFLTFKSNDNVIDILDKAEQFLLDNKAICFILDGNISVTNNMANDI